MKAEIGSLMPGTIIPPVGFLSSPFLETGSKDNLLVQETLT